MLAIISTWAESNSSHFYNFNEDEHVQIHHQTQEWRVRHTSDRYIGHRRHLHIYLWKLCNTHGIVQSQHIQKSHATKHKTATTTGVNILSNEQHVVIHYKFFEGVSVMLQRRRWPDADEARFNSATAIFSHDILSNAVNTDTAIDSV